MRQILIKLNDSKFTVLSSFLKRLEWRCGVDQPCDMDSILKNLPQSYPTRDQTERSITTFKQKIGNGKACAAFLYEQTQVIGFCFDNQSKIKELIEGIKVSVTNFHGSGKQFDAKGKESFEFLITDGDMINTKSKITFDDNEMKTDSFKVKYNAIEPVNGLKCSVDQGVNIIPYVFLEKGIENPMCVLLFNFDKKPVYLGSNETNCPNVIKYTAERMRNRCLEQSAGEGNKFARDRIINPSEGEYKGWAYYLLLDGQERILDNKPKMIEVNPDGILVKEDVSSSSAQSMTVKINFGKLLWLCEEEESCLLSEFKEKMNLVGNFKMRDLVDQYAIKIVNGWNQQDPELCFVLSENTFHHLLCPTDSAEEVPIKYAVSVAIDRALMDSDISKIEPALEADVFEILLKRAEDLGAKDMKVSVNTSGLTNLGDGSVIFKPKDIELLDGVKCGIEFRDVKLPSALGNSNPNNCARLKVRSDIFICVTSEAKGYLKLRKMILFLRNKCLEEFSQIVESLESIEKQLPAINGDPFSSRAGGQLIPSEVKINEQGISVGGLTNIKLPLEELVFHCNDNPCTPLEYYNKQMNYIGNNNSSYLDKLLNNLKSQGNIENFLIVSSLNSVTKVSQIAILQFNDKLSMTQTIKSIKDLNEKKLEQLNPQEKSFDKVPPAANDQVFETFMIDPSSKQGGQVLVKSTNFGLVYAASGEVIFNYKDVINKDGTIKIQKEQANLSNLPKDFKSTACFAYSTSITISICCRNAYSGARLASKVKTEARSIIRKNNAKKRAGMLERPTSYPNNSFNIRLPSKHFEGMPNIPMLAYKTFDNSEDGEFRGWVYFDELGNSDYEALGNNLEFIEIVNGVIKVKKDEESASLLDIELKNLVLKDTMPKSPSEYLKALSSSGDDYESVAELKKKVNHIINQKDQKDQESCVIFDVCRPIIQDCSNYSICTLDKNFGVPLKNAILTSSRKLQLTLDKSSDVPKPMFRNTVFMAVWYKQGKLNPDAVYWYTDSKGLCYQRNEPNPSDSSTYNCNLIEAGNINQDRFGNKCAFWYKNMQVKETNERARELVQSNRCCFTFYSGKMNEINEICVVNKNGSNCEKSMFSLLKGIKEICEIVKTSIFSTSSNVNSQQNSDKAKTIDDAENGSYSGYCNLINLNRPSFAFSSPSNLVINERTISNNASSNQAEEIKIEDIRFSCESQGICSLGEFKKKAVTNNYRDVITNYLSIIDKFSDVYRQITNMDQNCFVVETKDVVLICPEYPDQTQRMKKAITVSYQLRNASRSSSEMKDPNQNEEFNICFDFNIGGNNGFLSKNSAVNSRRVKFSQNGLVTADTNVIL